TLLGIITRDGNFPRGAGSSAGTRPYGGRGGWDFSPAGALGSGPRIWPGRGRGEHFTRRPHLGVATRQPPSPLPSSPISPPASGLTSPIPSTAPAQGGGDTQGAAAAHRAAGRSGEARQARARGEVAAAGETCKGVARRRAQPARLQRTGVAAAGDSRLQYSQIL
ncbi:Os01g0880100, partial [Oryza sativa Japonica Group]